MITNKDFLILTKAAGRDLRSLTGRWDETMEELRRTVLPALRDGDVVSERRGRTGVERVVRAHYRASPGGPCDFHLVWGILPDGRLQMSPDGKRWNVYLTCVRAVGVARGQAKEIAA